MSSPVRAFLCGRPSLSSAPIRNEERDEGPPRTGSPPPTPTKALNTGTPDS
jgi:hypothetical protein